METENEISDQTQNHKHIYIHTRIDTKKRKKKNMVYSL